MDIQKDIISKLSLSDQQKRQIASLANPAEIGKFLKEHSIHVPEDVKKLLGNAAGAVQGASGIVGTEAKKVAQGAGKATKGAGRAVAGKAGDVGSMIHDALDKTDVDEKLMGGLKGFGKKK